MPKSSPLNFHRLIRLIQGAESVFRRRAVQAVDRTLVARNWLLGLLIVEFEQKGQDRARYGERLIENLADALKRRDSRGLSYTTLNLCRQFYLAYPDMLQTASRTSSRSISGRDRATILQTLSEELKQVGSGSQHATGVLAVPARSPMLSWSHYVFLLQIADSRERRFYEIEAAREQWSMREMKRQFNAALYERLALSRNKTRVIELSKKGQTIAAPEDAVKDPYVLEFLGLEEHARYSESDLESALIEKLGHFLLELGKGFLFEARQKRITFNEEHYFVDLVFYNRLLRCYVVVDLKIGKLMHQDLGQMQMYVNYFDRHVRTSEENPTIGILLCKTKNDVMVKMTLPKSNRTIFASRYQLYLPSKEDLRRQIKSMPVSPTKKGARSQ